jgi:predicted nucleic acid-binding Zn ribbon protein
MVKQNIKTLGESIKELIHELKLEEKVYEATLIQDWKKIMGHNVAILTRDISLKNGRLTVCLKSSVLRNELYMSRQKVIAMVNGYLGAEVVKEAVFR